MALLVKSNVSNHSVVIPLFGSLASDFFEYIESLSRLELNIVIVDNNKRSILNALGAIPGYVISNFNNGGIAGGFNRGIEYAISKGSDIITLLDQDSRIEPHQVRALSKFLDLNADKKYVVGPSIWDAQRKKRHGRTKPTLVNGVDSSRMLISSGTTFRSADWASLGCLNEALFIDFVDHAWCFRAQTRGFYFFQLRQAVLRQQFGSKHPNIICNMIGMQLYSPNRHFYAVRNVRWLCIQPFIPFDLKCKEALKMFFKPLLWLAFEPQRMRNLKAVISAVIAPFNIIPPNFSLNLLFQKILFYP